MRKLKLDLAALEVETFDAVAERVTPRGTVAARESGDSRDCVYTAEYYCTWYPVWYCATNPIAFPTHCNGNGCDYDPTNTCYGNGVCE